MPFKAAHDAGYIEINPYAKNSVRPVRDDARNVEKDVFTPEQIAALIKAAPSEDWKGAILCGYYTGLRLRDIADLQWNAIDLEGRTITVTTRKTRKTVTVPIHPQFAAWLKSKHAASAKRRCFQRWPVKVAPAKADSQCSSSASWSAQKSKGDCCAKQTARDVHNRA